MKKRLFLLLVLLSISLSAFEIQDNFSGGLYSLDYSSLLLYDTEFDLFNPLMMEGAMSSKRSYFAHIHNQLSFFFLTDKIIRLRHSLALDFPFSSPEDGRFRQKISLDFSLFPKKKFHLYGGGEFYHLVEGFSPSTNIPAFEGHLGIQAEVHEKIDLFLAMRGGYNIPASSNLTGYAPGPFLRGDAGINISFYNKFSRLSVSFLGGWYDLDRTYSAGGENLLGNNFYLVGTHFDVTLAGEKGGSTVSFEYLYTDRIDSSIIQQDMVYYLEQQLLSARGLLFFELADDNGRFYAEYTFALTMNNTNTSDPYGFNIPEYTRHRLLLGFLIRFETQKRKEWHKRNRRLY